MASSTSWTRTAGGFIRASISRSRCLAREQEAVSNSQLLVAGCWLLVAGCWLLVAGCWLLVAGCWLLVAGCWLLVAGCWLLVAGCWLLVAGCWKRNWPAASPRAFRIPTDNRQPATDNRPSTRCRKLLHPRME